MSTTVFLLINTGAESPHEVWSNNYTSNCNSMLRLADTIGVGLPRLHKQSAKRAETILSSWIEKMELFPKAFEALNPPNGWGDSVSFLAFLKEFHDKCVEHSLCFVEVHS